MEDKGLKKNGTPRLRRTPEQAMKFKAERRATINMKRLPKVPCDEKCKKMCTTRISDDFRMTLNRNYNVMNTVEKRIFLDAHISRLRIRRGTLKCNFVFKTYEKEEIPVCRAFFLTTLGYSRTSKEILKRAFKRTQQTIKIDHRGRPKLANVKPECKRSKARGGGGGNKGKGEKKGNQTKGTKNSAENKSGNLKENETKVEQISIYPDWNYQPKPVEFITPDSTWKNW